MKRGKMTAGERHRRRERHDARRRRRQATGRTKHSPMVGSQIAQRLVVTHYNLDTLIRMAECSGESIERQRERLRRRLVHIPESMVLTPSLLERAGIRT